jgi:hypothetical protein
LKFRIGQKEIHSENAGAHNHPYTSMRSTFYVLVPILNNPLICMYELIPG